jgi:hypothetical protein
MRPRHAGEQQPLTQCAVQMTVLPRGLAYYSCLGLASTCRKGQLALRCCWPLQPLAVFLPYPQYTHTHACKKHTQCDTCKMQSPISPHPCRHDAPGLVSLLVKEVNARPITERLVAMGGRLVTIKEQAGEAPNGSAFAITTAPAPELDASNLVVGQVRGWRFWGSYAGGAMQERGRCHTAS